MNSSDVRAAVKQFWAEIWEAKNKSKMPDLMLPSFKFRGSLGFHRNGFEEFGQYVDFIHRALSKYQCEMLDIVVEDNQAFTRMLFSGIHRSDFLGYPPTEKRLEWFGTALFRFRDGKIAEVWALGDIHSLMQLLEQNAS